MKTSHVQIQVQQYADGRWGFDDYSSGKRVMVRLWSKEKAEQRATDITVGLTDSRGELLPIDAKELAEFREWKNSIKKVSDSAPQQQLFGPSDSHVC